MKIFIKTLKGTSFEVETNPDVTIADLKKKIETIQGAEVYPAEKQMLIHQGKVLKDPTTIGDNGVAENSFLVIMLSKAKPASSGASSASAAPAMAQTQSSTPAVPAPTPVTPQAQPASESVAVPAAAPPSSGEANVYGQAASNLVAGSNLETTIQQILDMGGGSWDRDTVLRALRAAFNNPERAIEYLYSGIPEQAGVPAVAPAPVAPPAGGQVANPSPEVPVPSSIPNASPLDLFPQGLPNVGANAGADVSAGAGASSLDFLRNSEQFQALRSMVQANPQILQPMLQELGKANPHLMRLIQEHQNDFVRLINEPAEEGEGNLLSQLASTMPQTLSVTPEERDAIERLEAMGFRRGTVLQVFFACNKDEELAANYLLDHMDELNDDDDDGGLS